MQELKDAHMRIRGAGHGDAHGVDPEGDLPSASQIRGGQNIQFNDEGLVVPKKLYNPCKESKECQSLHREIRWNAKA